MKSYVITIFDNEKSVKAAQKCIESGARYGLDIEMFKAITPANTPDLYGYAESNGIDVDNFAEKWSRQENCVAAFMSHFNLWCQCIIAEEEVQIFEHDAVIVSRIPEQINFTGCINLGKPSYGKFITPKQIGVNPLTSKRYMPGAHAYRINRYGANMMVAQAQMRAGPTDVFLNIDTFPWLQEYYPWPVEARDTFTTIQREAGCQAKHNYKAGYEII